MSLPLEAVPNFSVSTAHDADAVQAIDAALRRRVSVLDVHSDADHNRTVFTAVGVADALTDALVDATRVAVERIDLRDHGGVHPRIGAADVLPIVPLRESAHGEAHTVAHRVAERVAEELDLPVFLYGELCPETRRPEGVRPAHYRRGGLAELGKRMESGELRSDLGPAVPHPSAGATLVGVRMPLIAFNVELDTTDLSVAQEIAREVRESTGGFSGVRALGLQLESAGNVQVSMNIEDWRASEPQQIVAAVVGLAARRGVNVIGSELVGLMPLGAALAAARDALRLPDLTTDSLLELRLLEQTLVASDRQPESVKSTSPPTDRGSEPS